MLIPYFLIPIVVGLITQAVKPLFNKSFYADLGQEGRKVPRYGGMPSAHTSFAISLVTVIAWADGFYSTSFALACALMILILDDALRMRMFLGRYGRALYKLISKLPEKDRKNFPYLEQRLGHKPIEVLVGGTVGLLLTLALLYIFWLI